MSRRFDLTSQRSALSAVAVAALVVLSLAPGGPGVADVRAAGSVNLDQWATKAPAWQNGNLNGNNTRYPEGGIVPFRLAVEGLKAGSHTIRIQYDFTAGGHKAYDFLARYNGWVSPALCGAGGGGVSSMCPSLPGSSSAAFPSDGFSAGRADRPRCRGLLRRVATAHDLGRDDQLHQRPQACWSDVRQQHGRVRRQFHVQGVRGAPRLGWASRPVAVLEHGGRWST